MSIFKSRFLLSIALLGLLVAPVTQLFAPDSTRIPLRQLLGAGLLLAAPTGSLQFYPEDPSVELEEVNENEAEGKSTAKQELRQAKTFEWAEAGDLLRPMIFKQAIRNAPDPSFAKSSKLLQWFQAENQKLERAYNAEAARLQGFRMGALTDTFQGQIQDFNEQTFLDLPSVLVFCQKIVLVNEELTRLLARAQVEVAGSITLVRKHGRTKDQLVAVTSLEQLFGKIDKILFGPDGEQNTDDVGLDKILLPPSLLVQSLAAAQTNWRSPDIFAGYRGGSPWANFEKTQRMSFANIANHLVEVKGLLARDLTTIVTGLPQIKDAIEQNLNLLLDFFAAQCGRLVASLQQQAELSKSWHAAIALASYNNSPEQMANGQFYKRHRNPTPNQSYLKFADLMLQQIGEGTIEYSIFPQYQTSLQSRRQHFRERHVPDFTTIQEDELWQSVNFGDFYVPYIFTNCGHTPWHLAFLLVYLDDYSTANTRVLFENARTFGLLQSYAQELGIRIRDRRELDWIYDPSAFRSNWLKFLNTVLKSTTRSTTKILEPERLSKIEILGRKYFLGLVFSALTQNVNAEPTRRSYNHEIEFKFGELTIKLDKNALSWDNGFQTSGPQAGQPFPLMVDQREMTISMPGFTFSDPELDQFKMRFTRALQDLFLAYCILNKTLKFEDPTPPAPDDGLAGSNVFPDQPDHLPASATGSLSRTPPSTPGSRPVFPLPDSRPASPRASSESDSRASGSAEKPADDDSGKGGDDSLRRTPPSTPRSRPVSPRPASPGPASPRASSESDSRFPGPGSESPVKQTGDSRSFSSVSATTADGKGSPSSIQSRTQPGMMPETSPRTVEPAKKPAGDYSGQVGGGSSGRTSASNSDTWRSSSSLGPSQSGSRPGLSRSGSGAGSQVGAFPTLGSLAYDDEDSSDEEDVPVSIPGTSLQNPASPSGSSTSPRPGTPASPDQRERGLRSPLSRAADYTDQVILFDVSGQPWEGPGDEASPAGSPDSGVVHRRRPSGQDSASASAPRTQLPGSRPQSPSGSPAAGQDSDTGRGPTVVSVARNVPSAAQMGVGQSGDGPALPSTSLMVSPRPSSARGPRGVGSTVLPEVVISSLVKAWQERNFSDGVKKALEKAAPAIENKAVGDDGYLSKNPVLLAAAELAAKDLQEKDLNGADKLSDSSLRSLLLEKLAALRKEIEHLRQPDTDPFKEFDTEVERVILVLRDAQGESPKVAAPEGRIDISTVIVEMPKMDVARRTVASHFVLASPKKPEIKEKDKPDLIYLRLLCELAQQVEALAKAESAALQDQPAGTAPAKSRLRRRALSGDDDDDDGVQWRIDFENALKKLVEDLRRSLEAEIEKAQKIRGFWDKIRSSSNAAFKKAKANFDRLQKQIEAFGKAADLEDYNPARIQNKIAAVREEIEKLKNTRDEKEFYFGLTFKQAETLTGMLNALQPRILEKLGTLQATQQAAVQQIPSQPAAAARPVTPPARPASATGPRSPAQLSGGGVAARGAGSPLGESADGAPIFTGSGVVPARQREDSIDVNPLAGQGGPLDLQARHRRSSANGRAPGTYSEDVPASPEDRSLTPPATPGATSSDGEGSTIVQMPAGSGGPSKRGGVLSRVFGSGTPAPTTPSPALQELSFAIPRPTESHNLTPRSEEPFLSAADRVAREKDKWVEIKQPEIPVDSDVGMGATGKVMAWDYEATKNNAEKQGVGFTLPQPDEKGYWAVVPQIVEFPERGRRRQTIRKVEIKSVFIKAENRDKVLTSIAAAEKLRSDLSRGEETL